MEGLRTITYSDVTLASENIVDELIKNRTSHGIIYVYGVPRGGVPAAYAVVLAFERRGWSARVVDTPEQADLIVDDLIDSGATHKRFKDLCPKARFASLFAKQEGDRRWYVFPWEDAGAASKEDIVTRMIQAIGDDPKRGGLLETPKRVVKAWEERFAGYGVEPLELLKVFDDGAEGCDQMVLVSHIPVVSKCEHHMEDIIGLAHVAYIPNKQIVGLSKIARVVDALARRLQVQERLGNQIADVLNEGLSPKGVGVVLECAHHCMVTRGVRVHGTLTTTSALRGAILDEPSARAEFFQLIAGARQAKT